MANTSAHVLTAQMPATGDSAQAIGYEYYMTQYWNERCDPRTVHLPLMNGGPWSLLAILAAYFLFVTRFGPKWMSNRNPFELRRLMLLYNVTMVAINLFFLYQSILWLDYGLRLLDFKFPDNRDRSEKTMHIVRMFHYYMITKFVDFIDTVFFVFRKKTNQITVLHIYHHVSVPIIGWISAWVSPLMPVLGLFALLNCFCHVIMYSYYALSGLGPAVQKYLWWKRYITQVQLTQFAIIGVYGVILNLFQVDYPMIYRIMPISQGPIFFAMFANFYIKSYRRAKAAAKTAAIKSKAN